MTDTSNVSDRDRLNEILADLILCPPTGRRDDIDPDYVLAAAEDVIAELSDGELTAALESALDMDSDGGLAYSEAADRVRERLSAHLDGTRPLYLDDEDLS